MKIILLRHGQTEWNRERRIQGWKNSPLTPLGIEQLRSIELPELARPMLLSSDLGRAQQSAELIAGQLNVAVESDVRLRERSFGVLEGRVVDKEPEFSHYWASYHARYHNKMVGLPGVESEQAFENRILSFMDELSVIEERGELDAVVIVSHGEWIRAFRNLTKGLPSWGVGDGIEPNGHPFVIETVSSRLRHSQMSPFD